MAEYLCVGNPTVDIVNDRPPQAGGSVLYAAVQARRLGANVSILGRTDAAQLDPLVEPLQLDVAWEPAPCCTTFRSTIRGDARELFLEADAGPITPPPPRTLDGVLHLAPVWHEVDMAAIIAARPPRFIGVTPQGLLRTADRPSGRVRDAAASWDPEVTRLVDAMVLSDTELPYLADTCAAVARRGGVVVVTRGSRGCTLVTGDTRTDLAPPFVVDDPLDTNGAGDTLASILFLRLFEGVDPVTAVDEAQFAAATSVTHRGPLLEL